MKETVKSFLLTLLVVCSLVQSYFLIYRLPGSDPVVKTENDYIKTENMGAEMRAEDLIYPLQISVHMGDNRHTVFYPDSMFYELIYSRLKGRMFEGFQRYAVDNIDWTDIRSRYTGVELQFGSGVPVSLLQKLMQISADPLFEEESINRVFIYSAENEERVRVFFFSSHGDVVYEATKADLTVQDVKQQVDFGKDWTPYTLKNGYYIPEKPVDMVETKLKVGVFSTEQIQGLFFDPSITRIIREKDGSEIYTDSRRSLQVKQDGNWINYTDPAAPSAGENSAASNALSSIDFVNQHGGWNGSYRLEQVDGSEDINSVVFRQYFGNGQFGAFPIMDFTAFRYGTISLAMRQGTITGYERSLIYEKTGELDKQVVQLMGGKELKDKLEQFSEADVINLYPAYLPSLSEDQLRLKPAWIVELSNGAVHELK
ncbi:YycH family regulatory protein [Paenibacillus fonticola]|uniref:YycH family regulatory protein n=1 Tax=Paenibacillus fonticola TaxID=379896 RepID=UPI00035D2D85|nr:two-component system activity regulator YycH [Paenibacillus fonticola]